MQASQSQPLSIVYQQTADLIEYPHNARTHSQRQIRQVADSIEMFDFVNPIMVDGNNTIIAGHARLTAAKLLGIERVPTIRIEHLTKAQIRAYILADNRLAEMAGWDMSILAIELQQLLVLDLDFDVTITGFEVAEIDLIIQEAAIKQEADDVLEPPPPGPAQQT